MIELKDYPISTRARIQTRNTLYEIELEEPVGNVLIIEIKKTKGKERYLDWTPVFIGDVIEEGLRLFIYQQGLHPKYGSITTTPVEKITIPFIGEAHAPAT